MRAFCGLLVIFALASPANPCSMVQISLPGAFGKDGSVIFAAGPPDSDHPRLERLVFYDAAGLERRSVEVELDAPDRSIRILGFDDAHRVWLRVSCSDSFEGEDCDKLLHISPQGEILERRPVPESERVWSDGERLFTGGLAGDDEDRRGWTSYELGREPAPTSTRFQLPTGFCPECQPGRWVRGARGSALFAAESEDEIHLILFDPSGEELYRRSHPLATWTRPASEENGRLGPIGLLHLAEDDAVYLGQYAFAADCEAYQPPSLAILDDAGELVRVVPTPDSVAAVAPLSRELMVLTDDGRVLRLGLDGTEIESWRPNLAHWHGVPADPGEMAEAARSVERSAEPTEWLRVYPWAEDAKREEIESWIVAANPPIFESLDDGLFQQLAAELCRAHPSLSAAEALRRFERTIGWQKDGWFPALTICFPVAPPTAYTYALSRALPEGASPGVPFSASDEAREALMAWGAPTEMVEDLWRRAMGPRAVSASQELLGLFASQVDTFDERLRGGPDAERRVVRQLLLESAKTWHGPGAYGSGPHDALIGAARDWQRSEDPFVAATGRLVRVGHGDFTAREILGDGILGEVIDDARRDPSLLPWVGEALGLVQLPGLIGLPDLSKAADKREDLPRPWLDALIEFGLGAREVEYRLSWGQTEAFAWLWRSGHPTVIRALVERAAGGRGAGSARARLVDAATRAPWAFEPEVLRGLLEAEWLAASNPRTWPARQALFESLGEALDGIDIPLTATVHLRYRALFLALARDAAAGARAEKFVSRSFDAMPRLLPTLLGAEDVSALVESSREGAYAWLPLAAAVGVEPRLTGELEGLLEHGEIRPRIQAAIALARLGHPGALRVLEEEGLRGFFPIPAAAFTPFADELRGDLEMIVQEPHMSRRPAALRALRAIGPSDEILTKLAAEARTKLDGRQLPDVDLVWLLIEHGEDLVPEMIPRALSVLRDSPEEGWGLYGRKDVAAVLRQWLEQDPRLIEGLDDDLEEFVPGLGRAAMRWRAQLRAGSS